MGITAYNAYIKLCAEIRGYLDTKSIAYDISLEWNYFTVQLNSSPKFWHLVLKPEIQHILKKYPYGFVENFKIPSRNFQMYFTLARDEHFNASWIREEASKCF